MTEQNIATLPTRKSQEVRVVDDVIPILDTARFEQMQRIANVMAHSSLIPDSLCKIKQGDQVIALTPQEILSNCFLVVNQAVRWGMDPFAVGQCVSVVHGKLCYEGKLIAAVIDAKLGIKLEYDITGSGEQMKVVVRGAINGQPVLDSAGKPKIVEGTVADWKTTGKGSPWEAKGGYPRMLRYRGAREWGRVHAPSLMLGVYSDDEMDELSENRRASNARDVTPRADRDDGPPLPTMSTPVPQHVEHVQEESREADHADLDPAVQRDQRGNAIIEATAEDVFDGAAWLKDLDGAASGCESFDELSEVAKTVQAPAEPKAAPSDWKRGCKIMETAAIRIATGGERDDGPPTPRLNLVAAE